MFLRVFVRVGLLRCNHNVVLCAVVLLRVCFVACFGVRMYVLFLCTCLFGCVLARVLSCCFVCCVCVLFVLLSVGVLFCNHNVVLCGVVLLSLFFGVFLFVCMSSLVLCVYLCCVCLL